ncbi:SusC/RagA family TonB-linked outer membrane protein [Bacteroides sp. 214]|uniref:SusC/RagA family TonB-linked outer membrane protein n=1 Tax=Bacteroides sp. 214 TaxID=2302935 RepID=UPI0013D58CB6|nr:SusC/RagA family TonB-linked outer membrane protein [Bacteroides sp. 214]
MKYILLVVCLAFGICTANAQQTTESDLKISGRVIDAATSTPLPGIRISLPGVSAAMTDDNGDFTIKVPSYSVELLISGPIYQQKRVATKGKKEIVIRLNDQSANTVYKDVLTPLGNMNNSQLTNAVTMLDGDNSFATVITAGELLQGNVAGLNTILRSGAEGAGTNMFLRGFNSIYSNNQPLLVIDGVVIENQSAGVSLADGYVSTPLGIIDIKDIQRMSVLKDGGSLYGVKGANGVIIIETLRSKEVATRISIQAITGMNMTPASIPMLNGSQQKKYLTDLYQSTGKYTTEQIQNLPFINQQKPVEQNWGYEGNRDYYRYNKSTNWQQDELFNESFKQNYSLAVTGGDDIAVYALTLGFQRNEGLIKGTDYTRFNARINTDIRLSLKANVHTSMNFVYGKKNLREDGSLKSTNPIYSSLVKSPFMSPNVYNESNLMSPNLEGVDIFGFSNPRAIAKNVEMENSNYTFLGAVEADYEIVKGLKASTLVGLRFSKEREIIFLPQSGINYDTLSTAIVTNQTQHRVERLMMLTNETRLNYVHSFGFDNKLDATIGMRYQNTNVEDDWGKGYNTASDDFKSINYGLNTLRQAGGSLGEWNWLAWYANVNYAYKNRYFVTGTASFDASSRYGENISNYQTYPAISAAWLISSEEFMRNMPAFDLLKLRASYSLSGNDDIGNYAARHYYKAQNILGNYGLVRGNLVNLSLKPEKNAKFNIGLDMAFLNERLSISMDYYKNSISDMITYSPVSPIAGFSTYVSNGGKMQNKGFELAINARLLNLPALKWDVAANASFNKNKVISIPGGSYQTEIADAVILTQEGSPMGLFYGYKTDGVYATEASAKAENLHHMSGLSKLAFGAGDVRFVNMNNDDLIDEKDMVVIGDPNPDVYGGFSTALRWKRFSLSAMFSYSVGGDIYNYTRRELESMSTLANQTKVVLNRWKVEGQATDTPKATLGDPMGNARFSDRWIEDGSFLKFKNLTIAYDIPIKSSILTGLQVYAVGENLATLTKYKGYDPEFSVSTNPLGYGIDAFVTPSSRTFYVGVKFGL